MDILFLGTSSGTPTRQRNVTAIALVEERSRAWHLIDCGEATQHQLLKTNLSLHNLHAIFITHVHGDHCYGLPGLLATAAMQGRKHPLTIVAPAGIAEWLAATQLHTQMHVDFAIEFIATETCKENPIGNFYVNSVELSHRVPSFAYSFVEANPEAHLDMEKLAASDIPKGPLWGSIQKRIAFELDGNMIVPENYLTFAPARKIIIAGDNDTPECLREAGKDCQLLIHEATYTHEVAEKVGYRGHSYAGLIGGFAASVKIPNLILTHFSPRYQMNVELSPSINDIRNEALDAYQGNLFLAMDFATYRLDKTGILTLLE